MNSTHLSLTPEEAVQLFSVAPTTPAAVSAMLCGVVVSPALVEKVRTQIGRRGPVVVNFRPSLDVATEEMVEQLCRIEPKASLNALVRAMLAERAKPSPKLEPLPVENPVVAPNVKGKEKVGIWRAAFVLVLAFAVTGWIWGCSERADASGVRATLAAKESAWAAETKAKEAWAAGMAAREVALVGEKTKLEKALADKAADFARAEAIWEWANQDPARKGEMQAALVKTGLWSTQPPK